jgi:hypothetical protein
MRAVLGRQLDQPADQCRVRQIISFDQHLFARLQLAAMMDQDVGKPVQAWVRHRKLPRAKFFEFVRHHR